MNLMNYPHFTTLISLLTPIRIQIGDVVDNASIKANYGIKGLEHMLENVMHTSKYKNSEIGYGFKIILKIDDCDQEAIDWIKSGYEKYKSYVDYTITPRIPTSIEKESIQNPSRMHFSHIHFWMQDCYNIAPKSRYYWLWNHCNSIITDGWDEVLYQYKGDTNIPISPTYPTRPGGAMFPIIPVELVDINVKDGIETPICGGSPIDIWWEKKYGIHKCIDIEVNGNVKL